MVQTLMKCDFPRFYTLLILSKIRVLPAFCLHLRGLLHHFSCMALWTAYKHLIKKQLKPA
jgi:hypothetical protein